MSALNELPPSLASVQTSTHAAELTLPLMPFEQRHQRKLIAACDAAIRRTLAKLKPLFNLSSALDAACGAGSYSHTLQRCGLNVCGVDRSEKNVAEARRRYPQIPFEAADPEDRGIAEIGPFDFVLCFDVLCRLENPLLALRHLRALSTKCLLLESLCIPGEQPSMVLSDQPHPSGPASADISWYPSEGSLVKMLYRAGFSFVYRVVPLPNHEDFRDMPDHTRRRTMLLASSTPIDLAGFRLCPEPHDSKDPWSKGAPLRPGLGKRMASFLASPLRRKYLTVALRARRLFPEMPIPLRLRFGAWWLAQDGALDHDLMYDAFEEAELRFVKRLLRPGMTVLDIGAHHGLYTLLASQCVGRKGRVVAFEPSPREFTRLSRHVRINRRSNVALEPSALGDQCGEADLFLVDRFRDWGNSLRPPAVPEPTSTIRVPVRTLDSFLTARGISCVDFIKLDTEGAELSVLEGAKNLLQTTPRPALLVEVSDLRTRPWGYAAREILLRLTLWNYLWFAVSESGALYPASLDDDSYDANFVAVPDERAEEIRRFSLTI